MLRHGFITTQGKKMHPLDNFFLNYINFTVWGFNFS